MAITWSNTFDGPDETAVTVANSATYGDALETVTAPVDYDTAWAADGSASIRVGSGGEVFAEPPAPESDWSVRLYLLVPAGGYAVGSGPAALWTLDDEFNEYLLGTADVSAHAADLIGQPIRLELSVISGTVTYRVWWTSMHSTAAPDYTHSEDASGWLTFDHIRLNGGPYHADELALAQGEWIGPAAQSSTGAGTGTIIIRGEADGYSTGLTPGIGRLVVRGEADGWAAQQGPGAGALVVRGEADGTAGPTVATGAPVNDMWIGPLGLLHRLDERGAWERTPSLGVEAHVSLHGRVTASRARWAPRVTTLSWDRLEQADADALTEMILTPARADPTIAVIDPDAATGNLLTPEQSRGRPLMGVAPGAVEALYSLVGTGEILSGTVAGVRYAVVSDGQVGDDITWLHPYYGDRGWPVMPDWPVYLSVGDVPGGPSIYPDARLWLTFRDHTGAVISSAAGLVGTGQCEADAPAGAVTVTPHMVLSTVPVGLRLVGPARLTYAPQDATDPLGNGCPVYAAAMLVDTPLYPWRTTALQLQEVRSHAPR